MFYLIIAVAVIYVIVSSIKEDGGFLSKFGLSAFAAAIACLLLLWITDWELMLTLAKVCGAATILSVLAGIIKGIVE